MSDLFVEDEEDAINPIEGEDLDLEGEVEIDPDIEEVDHRDLDARKRLEQMLEEKRLRDELDDFGGY